MAERDRGLPRLAARALALSALLPALWGCASSTPVDVSLDVDPDTDFSTFETFAQADPPWDHPVVGERVQEEIRRVFESKGYRLTSMDEADLVVVFRGTGKRATRQVRVADPAALYYYRLQRYVEGTLEVDVFDSGQEKPVWVGVGMVDILSEASTQAVAAHAVREILAGFPERGESLEPAP